MKFKRYSKFADGHTKLSEEGRVDNKGRTIHSISYFGSGEAGVEKQIEYDDVNNIVKTHIKFSNKDTTDISIEIYKEYPYGNQLVREIYGSIENGESIIEESVFKYDKYGVVCLHQDSTNGNERKFVKYTDETDVSVRILVSQPFYSLSEEEAEAIPEEDKKYGYEVIVYNKVINDILYHKYPPKNNGLVYHYTIEFDRHECKITDEDTAITRAYNNNNNIIYEIYEACLNHKATFYEYNENNFLKKIIYERTDRGNKKSKYELVECCYEYEEEKEEE